MLKVWYISTYNAQISYCYTLPLIIIEKKRRRGNLLNKIKETVRGVRTGWSCKIKFHDFTLNFETRIATEPEQPVCLQAGKLNLIE